MGLIYYENQFSKLRTNRRDGQVSPHKIVMMFAVLDLFEKNKITHNRIYFDMLLKDAFSYHFNQLAGVGDRNNPHLPYFHLRSSGFWHLSVRPGKQEVYDQLTTASGTGIIDECIQYAYLDDELFELLGHEVVRKLLREVLYKNLDDEDRFNLLDVGKGWNWLECELLVDLYFKMLEMQVSNQSFVKKQLYSDLIPSLNNRNIKSVESKCQNVSAIMVQYGYPYVTGLKPRWNYQKQLERVVLTRLAGQVNQIEDVIQQNLLVPECSETVADWSKVYDADIPEHIPGVKESKPEYLARKIDYSQRESNNRKLGERGEKFVLEYERYRMSQAGRDDLIEEVEWSSKVKGDGLGYDIRSFDPATDHERYIEVKTTNSGKYQPFYISENEVAFSKDYADQYCLYRVYQFRTDPRLFSMDGKIDQYVQLLPKTYKAIF